MKDVRKDNLSDKQRRALNELQQIKNVVFQPADKSGNSFVWPISIYDKEAFRQLRDNRFYKKQW